LDNWFYVPTWERTPFPSETHRESHPQDAFWLIFADRYGGGRRLKAKFDELRLEAAFVRFGDQFSHRSDGSFELNPETLDDYLKLFRELEGRAPGCINIVHLGSVTKDDKESPRASNQNFGFYSLLHIAQAVGELNVSIPIKIGIISNRLHEVTGEERLDPEMATVLGPCGVIPKEFPNINCFNVDLPDNQAIENLRDEMVAAILSEFAEPDQGQVVAYRGRYRWERRYEQVKLPKTALSRTPSERSEIRRLKRGGVYLITGGTGGIGLALAKYFAGVCQPTLVLTKKTPFPNKSTWRKLLTAVDTPAGVVKTIQALLEIEKMGAQVEVVVAESSDREQMQRALDWVLAKFGTINGVIHAAGIVRAGLIQAKTNETAESVLAPKVYGTMILFDLLKKTNLDFFILFSSITTVSTPYAECDYSAANAFLDAFTYFSNAQKMFHTLTINWPGWKEVGQLAELQTLPGTEGWKQAALEKAIPTEDGVEAFKRVLNSDLKQVVVSPENLNDLLEESRSPFDAAMYLSRIQDGSTTLPRHGGQLEEGGQPTNEVEKSVAEIWSGVLGLEQIGIHDNFAHLGGHSLFAIRIVAELRRAFQIDLPLRALFDAPTVAELAVYIKNFITAEIDALTEEEAERLLRMSEGCERANDLVTNRTVASNGL
jgi:NAD(P)-dependent dehydrogenase (short-subunit alcohol dehydrogenase family)/acyl carrier protein